MENHFRNGLPQNVDLNCTVSFLIPSNDHKKNMSLYFHTFESLAVHNSNKKYYSNLNLNSNLDFMIYLDIVNQLQKDFRFL